MQLFTSTPSTMTLQAPQLPVSQPMWLPVWSRSSRMKWIRSRRASTSRSKVSPFSETVMRRLVSSERHQRLPAWTIARAATTSATRWR